MNLAGGPFGVPHLLSIREDGAVEWQRTFPQTLMMSEYESDMLAVARGQVALAPAQARPLTVITFETGKGPATCAVFGQSAVAFTETITLREETVAVEHSTAHVAAPESAVALVPLQVHTVPAACEAVAYPLPSPRAAPVLGVQPFRAPDVASTQHGYLELLLAKKFAELEETAAKLRKERWPDPIRPNEPLNSFYHSFSDNRTAPTETRLQRLREWNAAFPRSIAARIALARVLYDTAWAQRGSGFSDMVTATASQEYERLLEESATVLNALPKEAEAEPFYWYLRIHLTQEHGPGDVREVGLHALTLFPDPDLAREVTYYLYPQWGGSPEIYMKFVEEAARVTRPAYGDAVYAFLVQQIKNYDSSDAWKQYKVDWPRVLVGSEDLIRKNPDWPPSYHRFAVVADRYKDLETLKKLFERPQLRWYEGADAMWGAREFYDSALERARTQEKPVSALPAPQPR